MTLPPSCLWRRNTEKCLWPCLLEKLCSIGLGRGTMTNMEVSFFWQPICYYLCTCMLLFVHLYATICDPRTMYCYLNHYLSMYYYFDHYAVCCMLPLLVLFFSVYVLFWPLCCMLYATIIWTCMTCMLYATIIGPYLLCVCPFFLCVLLFCL